MWECSNPSRDGTLLGSVGVGTFGWEDARRAVEHAGLLAIGHPVISAEDPMAALKEYVRRAPPRLGEEPAPSSITCLGFAPSFARALAILTPSILTGRPPWRLDSSAASMNAIISMVSSAATGGLPVLKNRARFVQRLVSFETQLRGDALLAEDHRRRSRSCRRGGRGTCRCGRLSRRRSRVRRLVSPPPSARASRVSQPGPMIV